MGTDNIEHGESFKQRSHQVYIFLLENKYYLSKRKPKELLEEIKEMFGCSQRQAYRYIKFALDSIEKVRSRKKNEAFNEAAEDLQWVFEKAKGEGNLRTAMHATVHRMRLFGLISDVTPFDSSRLKPDLSKLTEEEIRKIANGKDDDSTGEKISPSGSKD